MATQSPFSGGHRRAVDQDRKRLLVLQEVAQKGGLLDPDAEAPAPSGVLGAFQKVGDFLGRSNYAMAGMLDVLQGTGRGNETVGYRMARELFSGIGGLEGSKEAFGEVLKQGGYGEGGRLSDVIGKHGRFTELFDPTARGTIGLGLDIFADPTTYIGAGLVGKTTKVLTKYGGVKYLNAKGGKLAEVFRRGQLTQRAFVEGVDMSQDLTKIELDLWDKLSKSSMYRELSENSASRTRSLVQSDFERQAMEDFVESVAGRKELFTAPKVKFGKVGLFETSKITGPAKRGVDILTEALNKTGPGRKVVDMTTDTLKHIDQAFNKVPFLARSNKAFNELRELHHANNQSSDAYAKLDVQWLLGRHIGKTKGAEWKVYLKALDNPERYLDDWVGAASKAGIEEEEALGLVQRWRDFANTMGESEVRAGYLRNPRENYVKHDLKGFDSGNTPFGDRTHSTFDDLEAGLAERGFKPEKHINYDPTSVFENRIIEHYRAVNNSWFQQEVLRKFATGSNAATAVKIRKVLAGIDENIFSTKLTSKDIDLMDKAIDVGDGSRAAFMKLRPELQAAAGIRALSRVRSFEDLGKVLEILPVDSIAHKHMKKVWDDLAKPGAKIPTPPGQVKHTFKAGPFRGMDVELPKGLVEDLRRNDMQWKRPEEARALLRGVDLVQNTFKLLHTSLFPAFNSRNLNSNLVSVSADIGFQAWNPLRHGQILRIMNGVEGSFKTDAGRTITYEQFRSMAQQMDIAVDRTAIAELTGATRTLLPFLERGKSGKVLQAIPRGIENEARMMHFFTLIRRGESPAEAMMKVKKYLFDYSNLSDIEKNWLRRLIPFYTWQSKNVRLQAKLLIEKPGFFASQHKLFGRSDRGPEADSLPNWMRGDTKIKLGKRPGKAGAWITNIDLPVQNIDVLWRGGVGKTMRENFSMISPLIKFPIEYTINLDTFRNRPLRGTQWVNEMGPSMERLFPKAVKDYIGLEKVDFKDGGTGYKVNGTALYLMMKSLFIGRFMSEGARLEDVLHDLYGKDPQAAPKLARFLTGMRFDEYDLDEAQKREIYNKTERLADLLKEKGILATKRIDFVPPQTKERLGVE